MFSYDTLLDPSDQQLISIYNPRALSVLRKYIRKSQHGGTPYTLELVDNGENITTFNLSDRIKIFCSSSPKLLYTNKMDDTAVIQNADRTIQTVPKAVNFQNWTTFFGEKNIGIMLNDACLLIYLWNTDEEFCATKGITDK